MDTLRFSLNARGLPHTMHVSLSKSIMGLRLTWLSPGCESSGLAGAAGELMPQLHSDNLSFSAGPVLLLLNATSPKAKIVWIFCV